MGQNVGFWHYELKNHHVFIKINRKMKFISIILYYICTIKHNEYGSKEVESVKGRYGREESVKYMVVGKVRSQSGYCL